MRKLLCILQCAFISIGKLNSLTQAKQMFARKTIITASKDRLERKVEKIVQNALFGRRK